MATEKNELNLSEEVLAISKVLQKEFKPNEEGHSEPDKKTWESLPMPEGITAETVKAVDTWKGNVFHAAAHALGEVGVPALKKHKKLDSIQLDKLLINKDKVQLTLHRKYETTTGFGATAQPVTKESWLTGKLTTGVASTSSAGFGRLREHFSAMGIAAISG